MSPRLFYSSAFRVLSCPFRPVTTDCSGPTPSLSHQGEYSSDEHMCSKHCLRHQEPLPGLLTKNCLQGHATLKRNEWLSTSWHREDVYFHRSPFLGSEQQNQAEKVFGVCRINTYFFRATFCFPYTLEENCAKLGFLFEMLPIISLDLRLFPTCLVSEFDVCKLRCLSTKPQIFVCPSDYMLCACVSGCDQ